MPSLRSRERIVLAPTRTPSLRSSPHPDTPPARVLPRQTKDELAELWVEGRAADPLARVGPLSPHELAVPSKKRLWGHHEGAPAVPGQHP